MQKYVIRDYQKGYEPDQVRIGREVAKDWIWPYAYNLEDLLEVHAQPDFDPQTRHYCFLGDEMVGYMFSLIIQSEESAAATAYLAGRSGRKRKPGRAKHGRKNFAGFMGLKKS